MPRQKHVTDETPVKGRMFLQLEQLIEEREADVLALKRARDVLRNHNRARAAMNGVATLSAAAEVRRTARQNLPNGEVEPEAPRKFKKRRRDGTLKREKLERGKTIINGPRLTLFYLENVPDKRYISPEAIYAKLVAEGMTFSNGQAGQAGVLAGLTNRGHLHRNKDNELRRLNAGSKEAQRLRKELEGKNEVVHGGYLVPST